MKLPDKATTDFWIKQRLNVLLIGEKGTGKSSVIIDAFNRNLGEINEHWLYFSTATLDPFIDLVGIPKEKIVDGESIIHLVRPEYFQKAGKLRGIVFDEINRCSPKVSNAIFELTQFKSINGFKFPKLEVVWAAANPFDEENRYAVEKIDEALEDRFQVQYPVDYKLAEEYFNEKFGPTLAVPAIEWWKQLKDDVKRLCSPRRLDYALEMFQAGGNLRHILNEKTNVSKLADLLNNGSIESRLNDIFNKGDAAIKKMFSNANVLEDTPEHLNNNPKFFEKFMPIIAEVNSEFVAKQLTHQNVQNFVVLAQKHASVKKVLMDMTTMGYSDGELLTKLSSLMRKYFPDDITIDPNSSTFVPASPNSPVYIPAPAANKPSPATSSGGTIPLPSMPAKGGAKGGPSVQASVQAS